MKNKKQEDDQKLENKILELALKVSKMSLKINLFPGKDEEEKFINFFESKMEKFDDKSDIEKIKDYLFFTIFQELILMIDEDTQRKELIKKLSEIIPKKIFVVLILIKKKIFVLDEDKLIFSRTLLPDGYVKRLFNMSSEEILEELILMGGNTKTLNGAYCSIFFINKI